MGSLPANAAANLMLIDPDQPERVYAAAETALYRSDDAGQTWQAADEELPVEGIAALAIDSRQPRRLYAATVEGALYSSEDGGTSWRALVDTGVDAAS